jgi:hypothetical protein
MFVGVVSEVEVNDLKLLGEFGVNLDILSQYQILCLPENIANKSEQLELVDSGQSITLSKLLKEEGVRCANSYDLGLNAKVSERRGLDLWLGSIWILNHAALPLLISVVGRLLGEKIQKGFEASREQKKSQRFENLDGTKVYADLKLIDGKVSAEIKFHGDANTFLKVLKGINNDQDNPKQ